MFFKVKAEDIKKNHKSMRKIVNRKSPEFTHNKLAFFLFHEPLLLLTI